MKKNLRWFFLMPVFFILAALLACGEGGNDSQDSDKSGDVPIYKIALTSLGEQTTFANMALATGDVDNDGKQEILVGSRETGKVYVYRYLSTKNQNRLLYTLSFSPPGIGDLLVADADGDGDNELLVGTVDSANYGDDGGYVYVGDVTTQGGWSLVWQSPLIQSFRRPQELAVGDSDHDGNPELAVGVSWYGRKLLVYEWDGVGFTASAQDNIGSDVDAVDYADLDGDNRDELVASSGCWSGYAVRVYDGSTLATQGGIDRSATMVVGELDGDSAREIVRFSSTTCGNATINPPKVQILEYTGSGLTPKAAYVLDHSPDAVGSDIFGTIADLNGDGQSEIVTEAYGSAHADNLVLLSYDGMEFKQLLKEPAPAELVGTNGLMTIAAGDLDGDGRDEVVVLGADGYFAVYKFFWKRLKTEPDTGQLVYEEDFSDDPQFTLTSEVKTQDGDTFYLNNGAYYIYLKEYDGAHKFALTPTFELLENTSFRVTMDTQYDHGTFGMGINIWFVKDDIYAYPDRTDLGWELCFRGNDGSNPEGFYLKDLNQVNLTGESPSPDHSTWYRIVITYHDNGTVDFEVFNRDTGVRTYQEKGTTFIAGPFNRIGFGSETINWDGTDAEVHFDNIKVEKL